MSNLMSDDYIEKVLSIFLLKSIKGNNDFLSFYIT